MAVHHVRRRGLVPVVLLGLLVGLLTHGRQVHWRSPELWYDECSGCPVRGQSQGPGSFVRHFPGHVRCDYVSI